MEVVAFHAIEQGEEIVMSCTSCYPASRKEKKKKKGAVGTCVLTIDPRRTPRNTGRRTTAVLEGPLGFRLFLLALSRFRAGPHQFRGLEGKG